MKIEKILSRPRPGKWIGLFVLALVAIAIMATSYNVEIFAHLPKNFSSDLNADFHIYKIVLGGLGFIGILSAFILFFARLIREMRVSQLQVDFLDRISHELRTPLSTLTLVSDLIQDGNCSADELKQLWNSHQVELDRIKQDVEMLLQAAQLRESKLKPDFTDIWIDQWLDQHWSSFQQILGNQGQLTREGDAINFPVKLDSRLLYLVFRNLLDNAQKFSVGSTEVKIRTLVHRPRWGLGLPRFQIEVSDHGRGFSPEQQEKLFKRFSRIQPENTKQPSTTVPGTGLGLYLAAVATKSMGMTLRGESLGEGKGARFVLEGGGRV
jgi:two-component system phosphate regulon sensor histidine kinase PhoR